MKPMVYCEIDFIYLTQLLYGKLDFTTGFNKEKIIVSKSLPMKVTFSEQYSGNR